MSISKILCCLCGTSFEPNDAGICIDCLRLQYDISEGIGKVVDIVQCKKCDRWNVSRNNWMHHELESSTLLATCLKMIPGLQQAKIIDASWIWTEHHSKRMKVAVDIERGVLDDKVKLRQRIIVDFIVKNKQCLDCIREATDHTWGAMIQLRQHVGHKRSLYSLESALLKAGLTHSMLDIQVSKEGIDFFFKGKAQADRVVEFISSQMPSRTKSSKKLISRDLHSNTSKYELTTFVEVAPLCRGDLVFCPKSVNGVASLLLVNKVCSSVHLLNTSTLQQIELTSQKYFTNPLKAVLTMKDLVSYVILDIVPLNVNQTRSAPSTEFLETIFHSVKESGGLLAEAEIIRESDFGANDTSYRVITHLGHILQAGDMAMGFDIAHAVLDEEVSNALTKGGSQELGYEVILVRKSYPEKKKNAKKKRVRPGRRNRRGGGKEGVDEADANGDVEEGEEHLEDSDQKLAGDSEEIDQQLGERTDAAMEELLWSIGGVGEDLEQDEFFQDYQDQLIDEENMKKELENNEKL